MFHAFPDHYTQVENLFEDGEWAILEWKGSGTWQGEFAGMPPNGKSYKLQGFAFFHVTNGKICFQRFQLRSDFGLFCTFGDLLKAEPTPMLSR
ncbi:hypothetical protein F7734_28965 [Scytonema sp. UIC 10036]|uniref:ester cyclase n=1 Tax=Scytonema sp. UIC 10036 TaxID=2304196 RepID=UPI0012DAEF7D|nr:ester cyclase [Scytonema sp. UIC 10036]MUG96155.1 hypothetical protein [Scytonema sp. UIC 10036]